MKQIKGFVDPHRAGDLMHALERGGFHRISVFDAKGLHQPRMPGAGCCRVFGGAG